MRTLREIREDVGLTQLQVAIEIGVSVPTISTWENNRASPKLRDAVVLATVLKCSLDDLAIAMGYKEGK